MSWKTAFIWLVLPFGFIPTTTQAYSGSAGGNHFAIESPQSWGVNDGVGVVRGWICHAKALEARIYSGWDNTPEPLFQFPLSHKVMREDTKKVCGNDGRNGFIAVFNFERLRKHVRQEDPRLGTSFRLDLYDNGEQVVDDDLHVRATSVFELPAVDSVNDEIPLMFLEQEFKINLEGQGRATLKGACSSPERARLCEADVALEWSQSEQRFIITDVSWKVLSTAPTPECQQGKKVSVSVGKALWSLRRQSEKTLLITVHWYEGMNTQLEMKDLTFTQDGRPLTFSLHEEQREGTFVNDLDFTFTQTELFFSCNIEEFQECWTRVAPSDREPYFTFSRPFNVYWKGERGGCFDISR